MVTVRLVWHCVSLFRVGRRHEWSSDYNQRKDSLHRWCSLFLMSLFLSEWLVDGSPMKWRLIAKLRTPRWHTSSQHNISTVSSTWTALSHCSQYDSFMFTWAGTTALPLAHECQPLMASHTARVSESVDQTPGSTKLPAYPCISVCVEKHTPNCCSSRVTEDKISRHWFFFPWHWLKGDSCPDIIVLGPCFAVE